MPADNLYNEKELLQQLAQGDEKAFREIYHRYWQRMYAMAVLRLQRTDIAEDIVQDVFTHLWEKREELSINTLENWLATAVKFKIISIINRRLKKEFSSESLPEFSYTDTLIDERLLQQLAAAEINNLPEKCRLVFITSRETDMSNKEIAEHFGISEKAVEKHITKAKKELSLSLRNFLHSFFSSFL